MSSIIPQPFSRSAACDISTVPESAGADLTITQQVVGSMADSATASLPPAEQATEKKLRCPWNWMVGEALCAVSASLAASESYGEQECADLWRHAGKEYAARARSEAAKGIWPVKGDNAEYPPVEDSIFYKAEQEPIGKWVWDRWQEIKKEVTNVILPLLKQQLRKDAEKHTSEEQDNISLALYSGTNWREVVEQVRSDYHKHKTRGKNAGQPSKGWTSPAFAAFVQFGPPAVADGRDCIQAFRLFAGARERGAHKPAQGRAAVRAEAKKKRKVEEMESGLAAAPTHDAAQCSPTTKMLLGPAFNPCWSMSQIRLLGPT